MQTEGKSCLEKSVNFSVNCLTWKKQKNNVCVLFLLRVAFAWTQQRKPLPFYRHPLLRRDRYFRGIYGQKMNTHRKKLTDTLQLHNTGVRAVHTHQRQSHSFQSPSPSTIVCVLHATSYYDITPLHNSAALPLSCSSITLPTGGQYSHRLRTFSQRFHFSW